MKTIAKYLLIFGIFFTLTLCGLSSVVAFGTGYANGGGDVRLFSYEIEADNGVVIIGDNNTTQPQEKTNYAWLLIIPIIGFVIAFIWYNPQIVKY